MHFKYRKESKEYCPKMSPIFGHSLPRVMGSGCPAQGLSMPTWWATDARVTGIFLKFRMWGSHMRNFCIKSLEVM